eukprot:c11895_g1_i1.p1 GENE.c11895_g1_i1~~c11895_g1_i1.p1  ORF type:complete len:317 (+),score=65.88 c11895_g1_i1:75-953(+)
MGNCSCCSVLGSEFTTKNLDFNRSTSQGTVYWAFHFGTGNGIFANPNYFLALRGLLAALVTFILIYSVAHFMIVDAINFKYYTIYLTHWTLFLEFLYFIYAFMVTIAARNAAQEDKDPSMENNGKPLPMPVKILWLLQAVVLPASFMVMMMYWTLVYQPGHSFSPVQVFQHGITFGAMIVDFGANRQPYLLLHGLYFLFYGALFYVWSYIHYKAKITNGEGHDYIYAALNWANVATTGKVGFAIILIVIPLVNLLMWTIYYIRRVASGDNDNGHSSANKKGHGVASAQLNSL